MRKRYRFAAFCILLFIAAQTFQELAYRLWIPNSRGPQDDLLIYLLPIDRVRAVLIAATIVGLIVPFVVITIRYFKVAPLASIVGVIFGAAFIGFELSHRALDFFLIGGKWAPQFAAAVSTTDRDLILQHFAIWNDVAHAWYFPIMLTFLLASCAFAIATWTDKDRGRWYFLAPLAYSLNALRLLARMLSTFGGQTWLDGFNDKLYFPAVLVMNTLLVMWFIVLAREEPG